MVRATQAGTSTTLFNSVTDASLTTGKIKTITAYRNANLDNV